MSVGNDKRTRTVPSKIKVCIVGDTNVGKSSILYRMHHNDLLGSEKNTTIGAAFLSLKVKIENVCINFHLWDTAGQERFNSLVPLYFRDTNIYMVVFDLNDKDSWISVEEKWIPMIKEHDKDGKYGIILVGNKKDLPKQVPQEDIELYCDKIGAKCIKISASEQTTDEIIQQCIMKGFDVYYNKKSMIFEDVNEYYQSDIDSNIKLDDFVEKRKGKCSNKVQCSN